MAYARGKIYKIINDIDDEIYVGSTRNKLCVRMGSHRHRARLEPQRKLYQHMNTLGAEHFRIVLIENYPCNNRDELRAREEHWRRQLGANLNMTVCFTYLTRRDYNKKYEQSHKHVRKVWREGEIRCECGITINRGYKPRHEKSFAHQLHDFIWG